MGGLERTREVSLDHDGAGHAGTMNLAEINVGTGLRKRESKPTSGSDELAIK